MSLFRSFFKLFVVLNFSLNVLYGTATAFIIDEREANDVEITHKNDGLIHLKTTGSDPYITLKSKPKKRPSRDSYILEFNYFCPDGIDSVEIFFKSSDQQRWTPNNKLDGGRLPKAEAWQPYTINLKTKSKGIWSNENIILRIDLGRKTDIELQLNNFLLRRPNKGELVRQEEIEAKVALKKRKAGKIDQYLTYSPNPTNIREVVVKQKSIIIHGNLNPSMEGEFYLTEFLPHENPWDGNCGQIIDVIDLTKKAFIIEIPRFSANKDRLAHRFGVSILSEGKPKLVSQAFWADNLNHAAVREMPRLRPKNKKGIGGAQLREKIIYDDFKRLGITATTVNCQLGNFIKKDLNPIIYRHQSKIWEFNRTATEDLDRTIKCMTDNNIVVSLILLIDKNAGILKHPEFDPTGIYSMANMTDRNGTDTYRAIVSFLAERYSRPNKEYGWITHWIVFNEVDYGWVWTNMGEQPMALYMDAYNKALRLTWLETRLFNPTSEVFISLTHNWDYKPINAFKSYSPKSIIDRMAVYSNVTGNYHWGLAYHPYPQRLLEPRTWRDTKALPRFNTEYITPKNIEVLDAYFHQKKLLYKGNTRTILLSEQGFHTPDCSKESMNNKAAAIAYTWTKILPLETIESFHYHRWVDHPMEGGLKLGLRTLAEPGKPYGIRKEPAFSVFSALETDKHQATIDPFRKIIGIKRWKDVNLKPNQIKKN